VTGWLGHGPSAAEVNPLANATFTRLTDFEGVERDAMPKTVKSDDWGIAANFES
jgi:hypothetical protein